MKPLKKIIIEGMIGLALLTMGCSRDEAKVCKSMESSKIGENILTRIYFDNDCDGKVDICKEFHGYMGVYETSTMGKTIVYDLRTNVKTIYQSDKNLQYDLTSSEIEEINRRHRDHLSLW